MADESPKTDVTQLLGNLRAGHEEAAGHLLEWVYAELRKRARHQRQRWKGDPSLETTTLVNEAYLKLVGEEDRSWENRSHFFAVSAKAMRQILIDRARQKRAEKRGGDAPVLSLDELRENLGREEAMTAEDAEAIVILEQALEQLEAENERAARAVECRFFGGMTIEETAEALGVSTATVSRDWNQAKAWLYREMKRIRQGGERSDEESPRTPETASNAHTDSLSQTPSTKTVSDDQWDKVGTLFEEVRALPPDERAAYLEEHCEDEAVREEVLALLDVEANASGFFEGLATAVPSGLGEEPPEDEALRTSDPLRLEGEAVGRYDVQGHLGGGGMGIVYRARDPDLDRPVALKFLPPYLATSPQAEERFVREARAAALEPPITTVHEIRETGRTDPSSYKGGGSESAFRIEIGRTEPARRKRLPGRWSLLPAGARPRRHESRLVDRTAFISRGRPLSSPPHSRQS